MVAINMPDHLSGVSGLPFTSSSAHSRQHRHALNHFGIKTEDNPGLGLGNVHMGGGGGRGSGYGETANHPFGSMGNIFAGMDLSALAAAQHAQAQGGLNSPLGNKMMTNSGVNPSALMNLGLDAQQLAQAQRISQHHAQQQHRLQLYDNMTNAAGKRQYQGQQQINSAGSNGSAVSVYSELASPDSGVDEDTGGHMTRSGGESLASSLIMAAAQANYAHTNHITEDQVNPGSNAPSSGKVPTKRGPKPGKKDQARAQTAEDVISGKTGKPLKAKSRKRVNTAEKRASHNAVERMRREQLNEKFLDLARLLPTLANLKRPSKSAIVNSSIAHLGLQRDQRLMAAQELRNMHADYMELLAEVQDWRSRNGVAPREHHIEWSEAMNEICSVEAEVFGVFTGVGGTGDDNEGEGDENDGDDNMEEEDSKELMDLHLATGNKRYSEPFDVDVKPFTQESRAPPSTHDTRQMSFHSSMSQEEAAFYNLNGSPHGSNGPFGGRSDITPPSHGGPNVMHGFSTSPTAIHVPAYNNPADADQVATWAAQQVYVQYAQAQQAKRLDGRGSMSDAQGAYGRQAVLDVTQQMLNASHPHLAASVFPPPISTESPPLEGTFSGYSMNMYPSAAPTAGAAPSPEQMEMWQQLAMGNFPANGGRIHAQQNMPTISQLKEALRAGMSVGMGLANASWPKNEV